MGFYGHVSLWHSENPDWVLDNHVTFSLEERERIMQDHVTTAVQHFCAYNHVYAFDVVNEAFDEYGSLFGNPWSGIPDYMYKAFHSAREALDACGRHDVKLYYNDWDFEYGGDKAEGIYNYLSGLLSRPEPAPIDGIGFQTHSQWVSLSSPPHDTQALIATMNRFTSGLGLEVFITETDLPVSGNDKPALYATQAAWFGSRLAACMLAINCVGYTTWGTNDAQSWRNYYWGDYDPLMFHDYRELVYDPGLARCVTPAPGALQALGGAEMDRATAAATKTLSTAASPTLQIATTTPTPLQTPALTQTPTPTRTPTSTPTSNLRYCPKPAYGAVYDRFYWGIYRAYLALKSGSSGQGSAASVMDPYPPPPPPPPPYP